MVILYITQLAPVALSSLAKTSIDVPTIENYRSKLFIMSSYILDFFTASMLFYSWYVEQDENTNIADTLKRAQINLISHMHGPFLHATF